VSKPNGRVFTCGSCGLVAHRDVVGATNIAARGGGTTSVPTLVTHHRAGVVPARRDRRRHPMDQRRRSCPAPGRPQKPCGSRSPESNHMVEPSTMKTAHVAHNDNRRGSTTPTPTRPRQVDRALGCHLYDGSAGCFGFYGGGLVGAAA
jgi:hypothetical protein